MIFCNWNVINGGYAAVTVWCGSYVSLAVAGNSFMLMILWNYPLSPGWFCCTFCCHVIYVKNQTTKHMHNLFLLRMTGSIFFKWKVQGNHMDINSNCIYKYPEKADWGIIANKVTYSRIVLGIALALINL